jgi:hypothetical protein
MSCLPLRALRVKDRAISRGSFALSRLMAILLDRKRVMVYAIFARDRDRSGLRLMHAVEADKNETVCQLGIGRGSGLVRDGDYCKSVPCPRCWTSDSGVKS